MKTNDKEIKQPEFKNKLVLNEDGSLEMHGRPYAPISKEFAETIVSLMKTNAIWEDIVSVNGQDYIPKEKYEAYQKISKAIYKK